MNKGVVLLGILLEEELNNKKLKTACYIYNIGS